MLSWVFKKIFYPKFFWVKQGATQCYQAFLVSSILPTAETFLPMEWKWKHLDAIEQTWSKVIPPTVSESSFAASFWKRSAIQNVCLSLLNNLPSHKRLAARPFRSTPGRTFNTNWSEEADSFDTQTIVLSWTGNSLWWFCIFTETRMKSSSVRPRSFPQKFAATNATLWSLKLKPENKQRTNVAAHRSQRQTVKIIKAFKWFRHLYFQKQFSIPLCWVSHCRQHRIHQIHPANETKN